MNTLDELNKFLKDNENKINKDKIIQRKVNAIEKIMRKLEKDEKISKIVKDLSQKMGRTPKDAKSLEIYSYLLIANLLEQKIIIINK